MKGNYPMASEIATGKNSNSVLGSLINDLNVQLKRYDELCMLVEGSVNRICMKPNVPNAKEPGKLSEQVPGHLSELDIAINVFRNLNNALEDNVQHLANYV